MEFLDLRARVRKILWVSQFIVPHLSELIKYIAETDYRTYNVHRYSVASHIGLKPRIGIAVPDLEQHKHNFLDSNMYCIEQ